LSGQLTINEGPARAVEAPVARQISVHAVVRILADRGATSQADLARLTGYSRQTISDVVRELEEADWLKRSGRTTGKPGRSSTVYTLNGNIALAAAIDLGGTKLAVAISDLLGTILAENSVPTDRRGGIHVVEQIAAQIETLLKSVGADAARLRIAVVGTPGVFHPETQHIALAPNIAGLDRIDLPGELSKRLRVPVEIENDVNLAARGEQWRGGGAGVSDFVFLAFGTGVGMGIVANGHLVRGARGAAGEIAYLPIGGDPYDPRGFELGTFESAVGSSAISARYSHAGGPAGLSVREVFAALEARDDTALATIEETARVVALAIASVAATLDPQLVILGGGFGGRPELVAATSRYLGRCSPNPPIVRASELGTRAGLLGALATALQRLHNVLFGVGLPMAHPFPVK
jgi:predicted NBD/HSP70 family sugar kinase